MNEALCPFCAAPTALTASCAACDRPLVVCGEYVIDSFLGQGGSGRVYGAFRRSDGLRVAVKSAALSAGVGWSARDLFERSANLLGGLSHRALPQVHAFEQHESGALVLVREAFAGGTLQERVAERGIRLGAADVRRLLAALLELLAYLQSRLPPVVHRDIKPANIMFRTADDWCPVLVDFDSASAPEHERTGLTIVGTVGYAAPEQFAGEATGRSDLYGIAMSILFVATHHHPRDMARRAGDVDVGDVAGGLDARTKTVLQSMVSAIPEKRPANAAAALAQLNRRDPPPAALRTPPPARGLSPPKVIAAIILSILGVVGALWLFNRTPMAQRAAASKSASAAKRASAATHAAAARMREAAKKRLASRADLRARETNRFHIATPHCTDDDPTCATDDPLFREVLHFQAKCERDDGASCEQLAARYTTGRGVSKDHRKAAYFNRRGCKLDNATACWNLAVALERGHTGVARDGAGVVEFHLRGCDLGNPAACRQAGTKLALGKGVARDQSRALQLLKRACDGGDANGCANLGAMYNNGDGVKRDEALARRLIGRACEGGYAKACRDLKQVGKAQVGAQVGGKHKANRVRKRRRSSGTKQTPASRAYTRSCRKGDLVGCNNLGVLKLNGWGVNRDLRGAKRLFTRACKGGVKTACKSLKNSKLRP